MLNVFVICCCVFLKCKILYRGISLLSIPGKVYGRVLIDKVREITGGMVGEEQCGFRTGRGCVDQVFSLKQLSEKYVAKGKSVYVAYMDLEKAYDRVDRDAMWKVLRMYGINGNLLSAIQSLYEESEAMVRVCRKCERFEGVLPSVWMCKEVKSCVIDCVVISGVKLMKFVWECATKFVGMWGCATVFVGMWGWRRSA